MKWVLQVCGFLCLILGFLGIFLPLLPTTPFVLLASACFIKSSPRLHRKLLEHKTFGPILHNWHQHRAVSKTVKRRGCIVMVASFSISIFLSPIVWVKGLLIVLAVISISLFLRLPVHEPVDPAGENK